MSDKEEVFDSGLKDCYCGKTKFRVTGPLADVCYCHCRLCRQFFNQPFNNIAIFAKQGTVMIDDNDTCMDVPKNVTFFDEPMTMVRTRCKTCGATVVERVQEWPSLEFVPVVQLLAQDADDIPDALRPTKHIFYKERVVDAADDLPKYDAFAADLTYDPPLPLPELTKEQLETMTHRTVKI